MNYVREVTDLFLSRCRDVTILSPIDFIMIAEWEKQEIPLEVILKSINEMCPDVKNGPRVRSVADIQDTVRQDFMDWLQTKQD